jgi:hypothetical protein
MNTLESVNTQIFLVVVAAGRAPRPTELNRWERAARSALGCAAAALDAAFEKGADPARITEIRAEIREWEAVMSFLAGKGRPKGLKTLKALLK